MSFENIKLKFKVSVTICFTLMLSGCINSAKQSNVKDSLSIIYPSDVIPFMEQWKILLGDGTHVEDLVSYQKKDFFYVENDGTTNWVVYKTPNAGITSRTSSNTRM